MPSTIQFAKVLQSGLESVARSVQQRSNLGIGYERLDRLVELTERITWARVQSGSIFSLVDTTLTRLLVVERAAIVAAATWSKTLAPDCHPLLSRPRKKMN